AITVAIVPAVCRMTEPTPNEISATSVTNRAVPMIAASTVDGWMTSQAVTVITRSPEGHLMAPGGAPGPAGTPCRQLTFPLAGILTAWKSEAPKPLEAYIPWPARNAT